MNFYPFVPPNTKIRIYIFPRLVIFGIIDLQEVASNSDEFNENQRKCILTSSWPVMNLGFSGVPCNLTTC
jgi:hypothetical protein